MSDQGDFFGINDQCGFSLCSFMVLICIIIGGLLFIILIILLIKKYQNRNILEKNYLVTVKAINVPKRYLTDLTIKDKDSSKYLI